MNFGEKLKCLRQERGKSRVELAAAAGVSPGFVRDLEQGHRRNPGWNTVQLIAKYLGVSYDALASEPVPSSPVSPRSPSSSRSKAKLANKSAR